MATDDILRAATDTGDVTLTVATDETTPIVIKEGRFTISIKDPSAAFVGTVLVQRRFSTTGSFETVRTFTAIVAEVGTEAAPAEYKILLSAISAGGPLTVRLRQGNLAVGV